MCFGEPDRCAICPIITNGTCNIQGAVYEITCNLCTARNITYQGEADRLINYRLKEHIRAASNPTSYTTVYKAGLSTLNDLYNLVTKIITKYPVLTTYKIPKIIKKTSPIFL